MRFYILCSPNQRHLRSNRRECNRDGHETPPSPELQRSLVRRLSGRSSPFANLLAEFLELLGVYAVFIADVDGSNVTRIAGDGTSATFSPDGTKIAYTVFDSALSCSHVEIVATDGSQADAPVRIRDCGQSGEFITDLVWFVRP